MHATSGAAGRRVGLSGSNERTGTWGGGEQPMALKSAQRV
jgi:hypothetical protein